MVLKLTIAFVNGGSIMSKTVLRVVVRKNKESLTPLERRRALEYGLMRANESLTTPIVLVGDERTKGADRPVESLFEKLKRNIGKMEIVVHLGPAEIRRRH